MPKHGLTGVVRSGHKAPGCLGTLLEAWRLWALPVLVQRCVLYLDVPCLVRLTGGGSYLAWQHCYAVEPVLSREDWVRQPAPLFLPWPARNDLQGSTLLAAANGCHVGQRV